MEEHHHSHTADPGLHRGKKKWTHYFWEFLMLFLAVFCGFMAENYREKLSNREKEQHYIENLLADLKKDTTEIGQVVAFLKDAYNRLDNASKIPIDRLKDFNAQGRFYHYLLVPYSFQYYFTQSNNAISQLRAGGFNLISNRNVIDSVYNLYSFYEAIIVNNEWLDDNAKELNKQVRRIMKITRVPAFINDFMISVIPQNEEIFIHHDRIMIQELYNLIAFHKASLMNYIGYVMEYRRITERLIRYLKNEYTISG